MTNIAQALAMEPELPEKIGKVVAMAGAITSPGNIIPVAETNVWNDPDAFKVVLTAGFDLTLVGLDVTRLATATPAWLQALAEDQTQLWGNMRLRCSASMGSSCPRYRCMTHSQPRYLSISRWRPSNTEPSPCPLLTMTFAGNSTSRGTVTRTQRLCRWPRLLTTPAS